MSWTVLDHRVGGAALITGYLLLAGALFSEPAEGVEVALATPQGFVFFFLLPACGLLAGTGVLLGWSYAAVGALLSGTYLAIVGIALALLVPTAVVVTGLGVVLLGLATLGIVAGLGPAVSRYVPSYRF
jgi:hypothetical protein